MLNLNLGSEILRKGRRGILTDRCRSGHAVHGPYRELAPGRYRVEFHIEPMAVEGDPVIAFVDVCGDMGGHRYAADVVLASELTDSGVAGLEFELPVADRLEFRVEASGQVPIFIADDPEVGPLNTTPSARDLSGDALLGLAEQAGMRLEDMIDRLLPPRLEPSAIAARLTEMLAPLRPHQATGFAKRRFGSEGDGGYVCVDDFDGVDTVLSLGINDNIDFDLDVAGRGMTVFQFDHTVDDPRPDDPRMVFEKKMIATAAGPDSETLARLIARHDRGWKRPNIFLKMDIENWEWPVLDAMDADALGRVRQITGEFHGFEFANVGAWLDRTARALNKLSDRFALVHVHANNCAAVSIFDGVSIPNVLEFTLLNRACYDLSVSGETFPTPLDIACDKGHPDHDLQSFVFGELAN